MQTTSPTFQQHAIDDMRPIKWEVRWSPTKQFDDDVVFFTLNQSLLNGPDILRPSASSIIQQWDKYEYENISDRVISIETESEQLEPYSVVQGMADIVVNNYDDYFTPNSSSPISSYIRPRRPFRILLGFGSEVVPVFIGLSDGMPEIDRQSKTARFHCIDFLTYLFEQEIDMTVTLEDQTTGDILEYLLLSLGLVPSQFDLDNVSFNRVPYFFVERGKKFGQVVRELMQAEQGRFWMDETGVIRFLNRQNYPTVPLETFDTSNVSNWDNSRESDIINIARIKSSILEEKPLQSIWELAEPTQISGSKDIWVDLEDPVTSVNTPTQELSEIEDSYYVADASMSVTITVFSKRVLVEISGTGMLSELALWGTPVRVVDVIEATASDSQSILDYEESLYEFETTYIQRQEKADGLARVMVQDYKDYGSTISIEVKSNPARQVGDINTVDLEGYSGDYTTKKIINIWSRSQSTQVLKLQKRPITHYFILNQSLLNGGDVLL